MRATVGTTPQRRTGVRFVWPKPRPPPQQHRGMPFPCEARESCGVPVELMCASGGARGGLICLIFGNLPCGGDSRRISNALYVNSMANCLLGAKSVRATWVQVPVGTIGTTADGIGESRADRVPHPLPAWGRPGGCGSVHWPWPSWLSAVCRPLKARPASQSCVPCGRGSEPLVKQRLLGHRCPRGCGIRGCAPGRNIAAKSRFRNRGFSGPCDHCRSPVGRSCPSSVSVPGLEIRRVLLACLHHRPHPQRWLCVPAAPVPSSHGSGFLAVPSGAVERADTRAAAHARADGSWRHVTTSGSATTDWTARCRHDPHEAGFRLVRARRRAVGCRRRQVQGGEASRLPGLRPVPDARLLHRARPARGTPHLRERQRPAHRSREALYSEGLPRKPAG